MVVKQAYGNYKSSVIAGGLRESENNQRSQLYPFCSQETELI